MYYLLYNKYLFRNNVEYVYKIYNYISFSLFSSSSLFFSVINFLLYENENEEIPNDLIY